MMGAEMMVPEPGISGKTASREPARMKAIGASGPKESTNSRSEATDVRTPLVKPRTTSVTMPARPISDMTWKNRLSRLERSGFDGVLSSSTSTGTSSTGRTAVVGSGAASRMVMATILPAEGSAHIRPTSRTTPYFGWILRG